MRWFAAVFSDEMLCGTRGLCGAFLGLDKWSKAVRGQRTQAHSETYQQGDVTKSWLLAQSSVCVSVQVTMATVGLAHRGIRSGDLNVQTTLVTHLP